MLVAPYLGWRAYFSFYRVWGFGFSRLLKVVREMEPIFLRFWNAKQSHIKWWLENRPKGTNEIVFLCGMNIPNASAASVFILTEDKETF